jgi:hypothetical protein
MKWDKNKHTLTFVRVREHGIEEAYNLFYKNEYSEFRLFKSYYVTCVKRNFDIDYKPRGDIFQKREMFSTDEMDYATIDFNSRYKLEDVLKEDSRVYNNKKDRDDKDKG